MKASSKRLIVPFLVIAASAAVALARDHGAPAGTSAEPRTMLESVSIDAQMIAEFRKAWMIAGSGNANIEGLVLVYRSPNGNVISRSQGCTNEHRKFSFKWDPDIIAIVHSHPNKVNPEPYGEDLTLADRFHTPVYTITNRGMYVYDPTIRKVKKLSDGFDWLLPAKLRNTALLARILPPGTPSFAQR